ncbi:helix-turn-helix transcriptional regulator [Streptosporangium sp. NPDC052375]|uniref:helix-turn-helix transcriptional regulator n=1 Tax=Streptosporangium sp. NPDC052375 TaxID=3366195 RepID=UPI0037D43E12
MRFHAVGSGGRLTSQERRIVRPAAAGVSSREIASQLFLSPHTVEYHLCRAYPEAWGHLAPRTLQGRSGASPTWSGGARRRRHLERRNSPRLFFPLSCPGRG